jgi:hypothetical protein
MALWSIYCNTEKSFFETWRDLDSPPTTCPNNVNHSVNSQSVSLSKLSRIRLTNGIITEIKSPIYVPIINFITQGSDISKYDDTYAIAIKIVASIDHGTYDYCFTTIPDNTLLYESKNNNNTVPNIVTIPLILFNNIPKDETSIDVKFKVTDGSILTLRNVSVYYTVPVS